MLVLVRVHVCVQVRGMAWLQQRQYGQALRWFLKARFAAGIAAVARTLLTLLRPSDADAATATTPSAEATVVDEALTVVTTAEPATLLAHPTLLYLSKFVRSCAVCR